MRLRHLTKVSLILLSFLATVSSAVPGADTPTQKAVRLRREALTKAINSHDLKAIKTFIAPSFKWRNDVGQTMSYTQTMATIGQMLKQTPDIKQTDRFEKIEVKGKSAKLTITRTLTYTDPQGKQQREQSRVVETWRKLKGRWMAVGEQIP